jgi:glycosyltransferase involved in cell wall biosynthesis
MAPSTPLPLSPPTHLLQLVSDLAPDDAVGQQVLWLDQLGKSQGWTTQIRACRTRGQFANAPLPLPAPGTPLPPLPDNTLVVLHHSIGSDAAQLFLTRPGRHHAVIYHNVTPPALLAGMPRLAALAHWGLRQLPAVVRAADLVIGCSRFNLREVDDIGAPRTEVVWLAPPPDRLALLRQVAQSRMQALRPPDPLRPRLLAVGRIVSSKNFPASIHALAELVRRVPGCEPQLRIIGSVQEPDLAASLVHLTKSLGLPPTALTLPGAVNGTQLAEQLAWADVLLQPSLHEGFGMPPVEALHAGVPVVGSASGALPEILGGVCHLIENAEPRATAAAIHQLLTDTEARDQQITRQFQHGEGHFTPDRQAQRMVELLGF